MVSSGTLGQLDRARRLLYNRTSTSQLEHDLAKS